MINARSEMARTKPSFCSALRSRLCRILADSFCEWAGDGKAHQLWLIELKGGGIFCFAGLWERWRVPRGLV